jgi:hypothetical protein
MSKVLKLKLNSSESWSEFKFFDFHELLQNPAEGQKKVPRRTKMKVS